MSGGIFDRFSPQGQGPGILGSMNQAVTDNSDSMVGLGLGLMSGNMEHAIQGYTAGNRADTLRRQQKLLADQELQKRTAAQAIAQKMGLDPQLAQGDPDTVLGLYKQVQAHNLTKEAAKPQLVGTAETGFAWATPGQALPDNLTQPNKKPAAPPSGYRWADGGALEAIPGGPGDKPTDGQSNAALYAQRMIESDKILSDPKVADASQSRMQRTLGNVPGIGNSLVSNEAQQADQAQRNFINATLRRESGAVISPQEFDNAKLQYFPQPGDGPDVLKQKADNRRTAIQGVTNAAGPAAKAIQGGASWTDVGGGVKIRRKQ